MRVRGRLDEAGHENSWPLDMSFPRAVSETAHFWPSDDLVCHVAEAKGG